MKNFRPVYLIALIVSTLTLLTFSVKAQTQADYSAFIQAGPADAGKLMGAYCEPAIKAVSYGMTSGWYHTAKTHNKLGIDVGVTFSGVMIPSSDFYFAPNSLGLTNTTITSPSSEMAPTIMGPKDASTYTSTYIPPGQSAPVDVNFQGPEGLDPKGAFGASAVPVPMIQLGIGTLWNTDLKIRLLPEQTVSGQTKVQMLGFGLLHDIKQHIPGLKMVPIDLSVLAAWNSVNGKTDLSNAVFNPGNPASSDGKVTYDMSSWVAQVLVSKKVSVLTFYGGIGYGSVTTKFRETGHYTFEDTDGTPITDVSIPVSIDFTNTGVKTTLGMRLKLGPIYLNGDYTFQKYNAVTVGLGVSVR